MPSRPWEWIADEPVPPEPVDLSGLEVPAWYEDAVCQDADPEIFFPDKRGSVTEAKALCQTCPVTEECLRYALDELGPREDFGVWGGTSQGQRKIMRRERVGAL